LTVTITPAAQVQRQAITLGEANQAALDLTDPANQKLYRNGMKALEGEKYDGSPRGLRLFMESFRAKALMYHWSSVLDVPDADPNNPARNFLTMYGVVTMDECAAWADLLMLARSRAAQDSQMMVHCILDSITNQFKTQLMMEVDKFTVHGYMEGLTLLKFLCS
jgi:hypothetical protein